MDQDVISSKLIFRGEVLWCSVNSLPYENPPESSCGHPWKISLTQFREFGQLEGHLEDTFSGSGNSMLVVLDASRNVTECFKQYEKLHKQFENIEVCMFYSKTFEPNQVWSFILENIKPLLAKFNAASKPIESNDLDTTSRTNAEE